MTNTGDLARAEANLRACAYNAFVNYDSGRAAKKMRGLGEAINWHERERGKAALDELVEKGIIDGYEPCVAECIVKPGGLFHVKGCPNDWNSGTHRERREAVKAALPEAECARFIYASGPVGFPARV